MNRADVGAGLYFLLVEPERSSIFLDVALVRPGDPPLPALPLWVHQDFR